MSLVREICSALSVVSCDLKSLQELSEEANNKDMIIKISEKLDQVLRLLNEKKLISCDQEFLICDEEDEIVEVNLINQMLNLFLLLNSDENEMISVGDSLLVQTCLLKLIWLSLVIHLEKSFKRVDQLFQSKQQLETRFAFKLSDKNLLIFCQSFIDIFNFKSIITNFATELCFGPVLGSLLTLNNEESQKRLSQLVNNFDQLIVIRNLLVLLRCLPTASVNSQLSQRLCQCVVRVNGVENMIKALIDPDETSQRQTTHEQRFQAVATVITGMPKLSCSLEHFYSQLSSQVFRLLASEEFKYWKIATLLVDSLEKRNAKLTQKYFTQKIICAIKLQDDSTSIDQAVEMINHLVLCRYDVNKFIEISSHLFYIRVLLDESASHLKPLLNEILIEIFSIEKSQYLLDKILFNCQSNFFLYQTAVCGDCISVVKNNDNFAKELTIKQIDSITQVTISILTKLNDTLRIEFFLLLLERMTSSKPSLLICSLVDTLNDEMVNLIVEHREKAIKFVVSTLQRVASQDTNSCEELNNENEHFSRIQFDSVTICLQILGILLDDKKVLINKEISQLKQCLTDLDVLIKSNQIDDSAKKIAKELKNKIESLSLGTSDSDDSKSDFENAMSQMNNHLMPVRAHSLIVLKQLIYAKDKHVLENKTQLLNAFKMCLSDPDSYIYLSAIKSLAALAAVCTEDVLTVLIDEFHDKQRSLQERVNIGEVLVNLSKSIGDFAHVYSKQLINCFLIGTKSDEPVIRISSFSNLGQFCRVLKFSLGNFIVELMSCVEAILRTESSLEVKRSAIMFLHLMLSGIDHQLLIVVQDQMKNINRLVRQIYDLTLDDTMKLHAQLALEEINRIAKDFLTPKNHLTKHITILK